MEVTSCAQDVLHRAASLLGCLNVQREQGQFCDCVLRWSHNSEQLYLAHRCVLAASSPVLASVLSCSGALVDLQGLRVSDSVLGSLLDYIYTGALPEPLSEQVHQRLLTAASLLQMKDLKEDLSIAWRKIQVKTADVTRRANLHQCGNFKNDTDGEWKTSFNFSSLQTCLNSEEKCTQLFSATFEENKENGISQKTKPEVLQRATEEELLIISIDRQKSSSSSSSSPPRCCEAVPVICHSSEVKALSPDVSSSQSSVSFGKASVSLPANVDCDQSFKTIFRSTECLTNGEEEKKNSSGYTDLFIPSDQSCNSSTDNTNVNNHDEACDSSQSNTFNHLQVDEELQQNDCKELKRQTKWDFDDLPSKHPRLCCLECHGESLISTAEEQSKGYGAGLSLPTEASHVVSDPRWEDNVQVKAKDEHCYFSSCFSETDSSHSSSNLMHEPKEHKRFSAFIRHDWESTRTTSEASLDHVYSKMNTFEGCKSPDCQEKPYSKTADPDFFSKMSTEHKSDTPNNTNGEQLPHIHWQLPLQSTPRQSDRRCSLGPGSAQDSDESTDQDEASSPQNLLTEKVCDGIAEQPNRNPKPSELLVESEGKCVIGWEANGIRNHNITQWNQSLFLNGDERMNGQHDEQKTEGNDQVLKGEQLTWRIGDKENPTMKSDQVCSSTNVPEFTQARRSPTTPSRKPSTLSSGALTERWSSRSPPSQQPFQCSLCSRSFSQRGSLNRHMRSHLGVRPFPCPCCPMTFSRQYRVTEHMRVHQRCPLKTDTNQSPDSSLRAEGRPQR